MLILYIVFTGGLTSGGALLVVSNFVLSLTMEEELKVKQQRRKRFEKAMKRQKRAEQRLSWVHD